MNEGEIVGGLLEIYNKLYEGNNSGASLLTEDQYTKLIGKYGKISSKEVPDLLQDINMGVSSVLHDRESILREIQKKLKTTQTDYCYKIRDLEREIERKEEVITNLKRSLRKK
jgi:hypothetical protein